MGPAVQPGSWTSTSLSLSGRTQPDRNFSWAAGRRARPTCSGCHFGGSSSEPSKGRAGPALKLDLVYTALHPFNTRLMMTLQSKADSDQLPTTPSPPLLLPPPALLSALRELWEHSPPAVTPSPHCSQERFLKHKSGHSFPLIKSFHTVPFAF